MIKYLSFIALCFLTACEEFSPAKNRETVVQKYGENVISGKYSNQFYARKTDGSVWYVVTVDGKIYRESMLFPPTSPANLQNPAK